MYDRGGGSVLAGDDSLGAAELNRSGIGRVPTDAHASTPSGGLSMTRRLVASLAAVGLAVGLLSVTSVSGAATSPHTQAGTRGTIVQVAAGDPQFSTLVSLINSAGLASTLSSGSYTVFAPTNAAFAKVPKATLDALAQDKARLKAVLLYHVVRGRVPASKVVKLTSAKTVNGASVRISVRRDKVYLNGSTRVIKTNVRASNGIIHVINRVLLPPS
jgi:uncharacterized surface protein with fasciclin (FAS1) repeats